MYKTLQKRDLIQPKPKRNKENDQKMSKKYLQKFLEESEPCGHSRIVSPGNQNESTDQSIALSND
jgi:hypothetical protein